MIKDIQYRIEPAKDGNRTLAVRINDRDIYLHSRINPMKEVEFTGTLPDHEKFDFLIILGCGLGYSLAGLRDNLAGFRHIVIIDVLSGIEKELVNNPAASFLSGGDNVSFYCGMEIDDVEKALSEIIDFHEIRGVHVIEHPQSVRIFAEYYDAVKSRIKLIIDKKAGDRATIKAFGNLFLRNALNNLKSLKYCPHVSALEGRFRGRKAVIVSSAPSIEDNLEKLKFYQDSIYIIAVDSVLPVLRNCGIKPDFVISIDPQGRIGEHFLGHEFSEALHVFSIVSPPVLVEKLKGYISLNSHPVSQIINDIFPALKGSIDSATGSVAGDAFLFALFAGFEFIAMTGFDFSFSNNIIYARETAYQKRYTLYFNNRFKTAETFNAAYIFKSSGSFISEGKYTRRSFISYRNSLDILIKEKEFKNVFTINERGLPLTNAEPVDFDAFLKIPGNEKEVKSEYIQKIKKEDVKNYLLDIKRIKERLLDERVLDEIIRESSGRGSDPVKKRKISKLIEGIN